jgi:serine/threonine-protein kinase
MEIGTKLGAYEIIAKVGEGGMGEVYRARDTRLGRDVAIKVLPEGLAEDATRLARFTREAQMLASLNHPNIAQIHGLEESLSAGSGRAGGVRALVMELVEGDDLSVHVARGPMPLDETLPIARQIAEALEAAHDLGIVHRDLKPANIKVRGDGTVKVLDFGLAKALEHPSGTSSQGSDPNAPTLTRAATEAGLILGTAAYMAPEQARGKAVDRRADIWSFGVVLFEMLTGTQVFRGETLSDTLAAVLTREPDWRALPAGTPEAVRHLVRRCLERDVRRRLQAIGEARIVLDDPAALKADSPVPAGSGGFEDPPLRAPIRSARHRLLQMWAAVAAGAALFAGGWMLRPAPTADAPVRKLDLALESLEISPGRNPAISPDGSRVIYVAERRLRLRQLDRLESTDVPGSDDVTFPSWSPDSKQVTYVRGGRVWKVSVDAGPPVDLGAAPIDLVGSGGSVWTADGHIVLSGSDTAGLWAIPVSGGAGRDLLPLDRNAEADFHEISELPAGRGLIFTVHRKGTVSDLIAIFADGQRRILLELPGETLRNPVYSPTGHIVYERGSTSPGVWAVPFSLDRLETTGAPFFVVPGGSAPSVARDGTLTVVRADESPVELVRVSRSGAAELIASVTGARRSMLNGGPTGSGNRPQYGGVSLSPDGRRVAVSVGFSPGQTSIVELARGSVSAVATGTFPVPAIWTKDSSVLIYASSRGARAWNLWSRRADGAGEERRYSSSDEVHLPIALSPDGMTLVYSEGSGPSGNIFKMALSDPEKKTPLFGTRTWGQAASFSPDGRYLAFESTESERSEIFVRPFPEGDQRVQVSTDGGFSPVWTNGGEILYVSGSAIVAASIATGGGSLTVSKPVVLFQTGGSIGLAPVFAVTPDGKTLLMLRSRGREQVSVILNWPRDLAQIEAAGGSVIR